MGWWDESIMGGDGPWDVKAGFQHTFGKWAPEDEDHDDDPEMTYPGQQSIIDFIDKEIKAGYDEFEVAGPVGFMMMELGWPISDSLKKRIIDDVLMEDIGRWNDPDERQRKLSEFIDLVLAYDHTKGSQEMPEQPGLFQKMFERLEGASS